MKGLKCDRPLYNVASWLTVTSHSMWLVTVCHFLTYFKYTIVGNANDSIQLRVFSSFQRSTTVDSDIQKTTLWRVI